MGRRVTIRPCKPQSELNNVRCLFLLLEVLSRVPRLLAPLL